VTVAPERISISVTAFASTLWLLVSKAVTAP
jgi:hypothetical protein